MIRHLPFEKNLSWLLNYSNRMIVTEEHHQSLICNIQKCKNMNVIIKHLNKSILDTILHTGYYSNELRPQERSKLVGLDQICTNR
jgi:predicted metal-dependent TIM-barrel fold hydrolase